MASNAFGRREGIAVDTHVRRLSRRLGLTRHSDPDKIERVLMQLYPRERWLQVSDVLIFHGRRVCHARSPRCDQCPVTDLCPSAFRFDTKLATAQALIGHAPRRDHRPRCPGSSSSSTQTASPATPSGCETTSTAPACGWRGQASSSGVRTDLGAHDAAVLEALGVLVAVDDAGERRLLERRLRQLQALERLQALVERELADLYPGARGQSSPPSSSGASDTSIPPSSS